MTTTVETLNSIRSKGRKKNLIVLLIVVAILLIAFVISLYVGPLNIPFERLMPAIFGIGDPGDVYAVQGTRLPRLLCTMLVGAALSISGLVMQGLFRNPMASPSVLGVSSGAAFGAALAMGLGVGSFLGGISVPILAFVMCFGTTALVYVLAKTNMGVSVTMLLLAGIAVGAFFNGAVSAIQYFADDSTLPGIVYWLMGSFASCKWSSLSLATIPIISGIVIIGFCARDLNLISLGEEQAENLGVNVKKTRIIILIGTSLAVAGSVAISGIIGFVGLIIPHLFRMIVGPDHRVLVPLSIIGGAAFMMIVDTFSKWVIMPGELPVGILTALLGAPFFIYILRTRKNYKMGGE